MTRMRGGALISFFVPFVGSPTRKFIRVHPGTSGYKKNEKTPQWHRRTRLPVAAPSRCVSLLAPLSAPRAPLLSNYIALYQTIEILNAAPKHKIGRLPVPTPALSLGARENGPPTPCFSKSMVIGRWSAKVPEDWTHWRSKVKIAKPPRFPAYMTNGLFKNSGQKTKPF